MVPKSCQGDERLGFRVERTRKGSGGRVVLLVRQQDRNPPMVYFEPPVLLLAR
jgi:hypothetical protein